LDLCLYLVRAAMLTNGVKAGEASEYLSQVHTTRAIVGIANDYMRQIELYPSDEIDKPLIRTEGEAIWPLTWYFRGFKLYRHYTAEHENAKVKYQILDDSVAKDTHPEYTMRTEHLRGWWVPDFTKMTWKKFLNYAWNHTPWSPVGYSDVHVFVKKEQ
jgi:hypothetical protein